MNESVKTVIIIAAVIVAVVVVIALGFPILVKNDIVMKNNAIDKAWTNVQSAYQARLDTLPKFAETARFSVEFQMKLTSDNAKYREGVSQAGAEKKPSVLQEKADADYNALLFAVRAEAVPEAKLDQLTELNDEIDNAERVIRHQRDAYNGAVNDYNNAIQTVPGVWYASGWGFESKQGFAAQKGAENSPALNLPSLK